MNTTNDEHTAEIVKETSSVDAGNVKHIARSMGVVLSVPNVE